MRGNQSPPDELRNRPEFRKTLSDNAEDSSRMRMFLSVILFLCLAVLAPLVSMAAKSVYWFIHGLWPDVSIEATLAFLFSWHPSEQLENIQLQGLRRIIEYILETELWKFVTFFSICSFSVLGVKLGWLDRQEESHSEGKKL